MKTKDYRNGLRDGIPVALGYFAVSFAFGMEAATNGLSIIEHGAYMFGSINQFVRKQLKWRLVTFNP